MLINLFDKLLAMYVKQAYNAKHGKTTKRQQSTTALLFFTHTRVAIYSNACIITHEREGRNEGCGQMPYLIPSQATAC